MCPDFQFSFSSSGIQPGFKDYPALSHSMFPHFAYTRHQSAAISLILHNLVLNLYLSPLLYFRADIWKCNSHHRHSYLFMEATASLFQTRSQPSVVFNASYFLSAFHLFQPGKSHSPTAPLENQSLFTYPLDLLNISLIHSVVLPG